MIAVNKIKTNWNTPVAFFHAQITKSFPMLNLHFMDLFIFWRVQVMPLNFRNIGNNSCANQGINLKQMYKKVTQPNKNNW